MHKININYQFLLVKFPIIFPIIYAFVLYRFPNLETELVVITILLLAETHFGSTLPFLLDRSNSAHIKLNRIGLVIIPILIVILSLMGFFLINKLFLLVFFSANMYHVTRQSFGVCKLYCKDANENKFQEISIYIISLFFFLIGFFRFYLPIIEEKNILIDVVNSDEGGRFYRNETRNIVSELKGTKSISLTKKYIWASHNQIVNLIRQNLLSIEARNLFASFNIDKIK